MTDRPTATATHPRFGNFAEGPYEPDVQNLEDMRSHPAMAGTFRIDAQHGANGWRIVSSAVPNAREVGGHEPLEIFVRELPDAQFIVSLLNTAVDQLRPDVEESDHV